MTKEFYQLCDNDQQPSFFNRLSMKLTDKFWGFVYFVFFMAVAALQLLVVSFGAGMLVKYLVKRCSGFFSNVCFC